MIHLSVKNTCNASIKSIMILFWQIHERNGSDINAVDSLGFPFLTYCSKANVSDDRGLIEMLSDNIDYFKSKPVNPYQNYYLTWQWILSRKNHTGVRKNLSSNYDQDSVETITKTVKGGEKTTRKNRICSCQSKVGHRKDQLLDGKV